MCVCVCVCVLQVCELFLKEACEAAVQHASRYSPPLSSSLLHIHSLSSVSLPSSSLSFSLSLWEISFFSLYLFPLCVFPRNDLQRRGDSSRLCACLPSPSSFQLLDRMSIKATSDGGVFEMENAARRAVRDRGTGGHKAPLVRFVHVPV